MLRFLFSRPETERTERPLLVLAVCLFSLLMPLSSAAAIAHNGQRGGGPHPQGYLGIEFHDVSGDEANALHLRAPQGAEVVMVDHDGPAGKAGLRPHDIITALNGQVIDSAAALRRMIHEAGANVQIALSVFRSGKTMTLSARLADRESVERDAQKRLKDIDTGEAEDAYTNGFIASAAAPAAMPTVRDPSFTQDLLNAMIPHGTPFTGLALSVMEPQLCDYFGAPKGTGLLVHAVTPNSPGAFAGLHAGDIVLRADNVPMKTMSNWTKHLHLMRGKPVALIVLRDRHEQTLTLTPGLKHKSAVTAPQLWPAPARLVA